jgi:hypothetical protein
VPLPRFELALESQEVGLQVRRGLVAELPVLLQRLLDDLAEVGRRRRGDLGQRLRSAIQDRVVDDRVRVALEGHLPGRHLVEHRAERKEIGAGVGELSPRLLGRHVMHRSHHRSRHGEWAGLRLGHELRDLLAPRRRRLDLRETEVQDLHLSAVVDHEIGGLQVPVRDPFRVRRLERVRDLDPVVEELVDLDALPAHALGERRALDELHHDEGAPVVLLDRVHVQMPGWFSAEAARASRLKRSSVGRSS